MTTDSATIKQMQCPECGGLALLYQYPGKYAGIWECSNCGASDNCKHENRHIETVTVDYMRDGEPDQRDEQVYICDDCLRTVPFYIADPVVDRAEALADAQIMEALGK